MDNGRDTVQAERSSINRGHEDLPVTNPREDSVARQNYTGQPDSVVGVCAENVPGCGTGIGGATEENDRGIGRGHLEVPYNQINDQYVSRLPEVIENSPISECQPDFGDGAPSENLPLYEVDCVQTINRDGGGIEPCLDAERDEEEVNAIILVPLEDVQFCPVCKYHQRNVGFLNLTDLSKHFREVHGSTKIVWQCRACGKGFPGLHNCRCHLPKCKPVREKPQPNYKCEKCSQEFQTTRGLSTHERHRHPELRNKKRQAEHERPKGQPGRRNFVWTDEEIVRLRMLDSQFTGASRPNVEIRKLMPTKTLKQISDKRRELKKQNENNLEANTQEDEAASIYTLEEDQGAYDTAGQGSQIPLPNLGIEELDEVSGNTWKEMIGRAIIEDTMDSTHELYDTNNELDKIFQETKDGQDAQLLIDNWISNSFTPTVLGTEQEEKGKGTNSAGNSKDRSGNKKKRSSNHNRRARYKYARCQELYNKCPKKLIEVALNGDFSVVEEKKEIPKDEDIRRLYEEVWGQTGPVVKAKEEIQEASSLIAACPPYTAEEISKRISRIKNNTAAGPDQIKKTHLRKEGMDKVLAKLFNLLVFTGHYPTPWKINRTTLIPKPKKDLSDARNWRPITIGSLVARLFSATLDKRIRGVTTLSERQKGFVQEDGCKNNIRLVETIASKMKADKGGVMCIMDISKAFDTIPHSALGPGLKEKGVPEHMVQLINNMYIDCSTVIKTQGRVGVEIGLKRGVKQGDPLSPILFNLIMDPIIKEISSSSTGIKINNTNITVLAFADDLILIGKSRREAQNQLQMLDKHLTGLGMKLSTEKCLTFEIVGRKKTWYAKDPKLTVQDLSVPYISPESAFKYLGVDITPWNNVQCEGISTEILESVGNIKKMKLKPHQKMDLIQRYLIPHFLHKLIACAPQGSTLKEIDNGIRQEAKSILHLTPSTTDGLFYTSKLHGGLGLPRIEHLVKIAVLKHALKAEGTTDDALREAMQEVSIQKKLSGYANSLRINWPTSMQGLQAAKKRLRKENTDRWQQLISQGQGVEYFREDRIGNAWLSNPKLLKPSRYIDALKMRTNTFGNKTTLSRAKMTDNVSCRKCGAQPETLGHIIGGCISVKPMRIRRHDEIKDLIAKIAGRSCAVFPEPTVRVEGNLLKPDLVIKNQEKLIVVDVTVRYEIGGSLRRAYTEKVEKYKETAELIKGKLGCKTAEVLPIVVGARGAMTVKTVRNLKALKFQKKDLLTVSMIALRSSIEIANAFIDYDNIN